METIRWNPQGSDTPRRCKACRCRNSAYNAISTASARWGASGRVPEAVGFWRLLQDVARQFARYVAARKASRTGWAPIAPLAQAVARLAVALDEMEPWTRFENCSCNRGTCGPTPRRRKPRSRERVHA